MTYRQRDLVLLWGNAAGRCSFRDCPNEIVIYETGDIVGHVAHIVARSKDGPRGDSHFPEDQLDVYENLILLCPYHHSVIDTQPSRFTPEVLRRMKMEHERRTRIALSKGIPWSVDLAQIYYLNVPRICILAGMHGMQIDVSWLDGATSLHSVGMRVLGLVHEFRDVLEKLQVTAIPFENLGLANTDEVGATASFKDCFRAKNVPGLDEFENGAFSLSGDLARDPHIYATHGSTKCVLTLDPRWFATTTSFSDFRQSGRLMLAGLFTIKQIELNARKATGTPIVLGIPTCRLDAWEIENRSPHAAT